MISACGFKEALSHFRLFVFGGVCVYVCGASMCSVRELMYGVVR